MEVNVAVERFVTDNPNAGLVVVGDLKTNHSEWEAFARTMDERVVYLHPDDQTTLPDMKLVQHIPWNHFGRKSIGFLYAIQHGAKRIYDFDDDNHLTSSPEEVANMRCMDVHTSHHVFNPYPHFQPTPNTTFVWPRGHPVQFINDPETYNVSVTPSSVPYEQLAVVQSLADHDPDVDAIYRMTRPLPIDFANRDTILVSNRGTFTPWNAQAVLINSPAFWGMLLPISVTGRVSDIWRSFITSRLLWETDYSVGFSAPIVAQYRNPHSYMQDFEDEDDLYHKTDSMLATLASWTSDGHATLDSAYLSLIRTLASKHLVSDDDVQLAVAWVDDLAAAGYDWPPITRRHPSFTPRIRPVVDQRTLALEMTETQKSPNRTLVILFGNIRGGEATWHTMYKHLLDVNNADLALCIGETTDRNSSLLQRASYVWEYEEKDDWGEYLDTIGGDGSYRDIAEVLQLGGVSGVAGAGGIQWFLKHEIWSNIQKHQLDTVYDRFVITRTDFYYECDHDLRPLDSNFIWIPAGMDWGGINDRHMIVNKAQLKNSLTIIDPIVRSPERYHQFASSRASEGLETNPEVLLLERLTENKQSARIRRFDPMMFTVALPTDPTRWTRHGEERVPGEDVLVKYPREYNLATKTCSSTGH